MTDREREILLLCCRPQQEATCRDSVRRFAQCFSSPRRLLEEAVRHGVAGLVAERLLEAAGEELDGEFRMSLKQERIAASKQALLQGAALHRILEAFAESGIEAICPKGPAVSAYLYRSPARRSSLDLDLLVEDETVEAALKRLIGLGYRPRSSGLSSTDVVQLAADAAMRRLVPSGQILMTHEGSGVIVEVHWRLHNRCTSTHLRAETAWRGRRSTTFLGKPLWILQPEELLVYLCAHGCQHGWSRLKWIVDVAWLQQRETDLNWSKVETLARDSKGQRALRLGLRLACDWLGAQSPAGAAAKKFDGRLEPLSRRVLRLQRMEGSDASAAVNILMFHMLSSDNLRSAMGVFWDWTAGPNLRDYFALPRLLRWRPILPLARIPRLLAWMFAELGRNVWKTAGRLGRRENRTTPSTGRLSR